MLIITIYQYCKNKKLKLTTLKKNTNLIYIGIMGVKWISCGDKKILHVDYNGVKSEDEMLRILYEEVAILKASPERQLILVNIGDSFTTEKYKQETQKFTKEVMRHKAEKTAIVGMVGLKKFIFSTMIKLSDGHVKLFDTEDDAKIWLKA